MDSVHHEMPPTEMREFGPVQILTVAFDGSHFKGEILPELERLKTLGLIRVIDLLLIRKDSTGAAATLTATDLDWEWRPIALGATNAEFAEVLAGLRPGDQVIAHSEGLPASNLDVSESRETVDLALGGKPSDR